MLNIKVVQAVDIDTIEEHDLKNIIQEYVKTKLPVGANVSNIDFIIRRNPTRIAAKCDAIFGEVPESITEPEEKIEITPDTPKTNAINEVVNDILIELEEESLSLSNTPTENKNTLLITQTENKSEEVKQEEMKQEEVKGFNIAELIGL